MGAISGIWIVTPQRHDKLVTKAVGIIQSFVLYFVLSKIEYRIYDFILSLVSHYFLMKNLSAVWSFFSSLWFGFFCRTHHNYWLRQNTLGYDSQPNRGSLALNRPICCDPKVLKSSPREGFSPNYSMLCPLQTASRPRVRHACHHIPTKRTPVWAVDSYIICNTLICQRSCN